MLWLIYHPFELVFRIWSYTAVVILEYVETVADKITGDYDLNRRTEYMPEQTSSGVPATPTRATVTTTTTGELSGVPVHPGTPGKTTKRIKLVFDINLSPSGSRIVNVATDNTVLPVETPSWMKRIFIRTVRMFSSTVKLSKNLLIVFHNVIIPHAKIHRLGNQRDNRKYKSPTRRVPGFRRILGEIPFGLFGLKLTSSKCIITVGSPNDNEADASHSPSEGLVPAINSIRTPRRQMKRKLSETDASSPFSGLPSEPSIPNSPDTPDKSSDTILSDSEHTEHPPRSP